MYRRFVRFRVSTKSNCMWMPFIKTNFNYLNKFTESEKMFLGPQQDAHASANLMHTNRQRLIHRAKVNSFRLSFVIIIAFLICWLPYCTLMVLFQFVNIDEVVSAPKISWLIQYYVKSLNFPRKIVLLPKCLVSRLNWFVILFTFRQVED